MSQPPLAGDTPEEPRRSPIPAALTELGQRLAGASRPESVARAVARALQRVLHPDHLQIGLFAPSGDLTVVFAAGAPPATADDPLLHLPLRNGPTLLSTDVGAGLAVLGVTAPHAPGSWLGAPIAASEPFGVVALGTDAPGRFTGDDLNLAAAIASQAGIAVDRIRLVDRIAAAKREWEQTADAIHQAICIVDASGIVRRTNRAFSELVEVPVRDIPGRSCMALVPSDWADQVREMLAAPHHTASCELRAGGQQLSLTFLPLHDVSDTAAVLVIEDLTERRRLQDQLIQSEKMSAIGQLIAGVAHDLNNPLASVVGFADYLAEGDRAPPELREPLRAIQQEAERAAGIVRNLLTFARKQEHQRHVIPIESILTSTLLLLKNQLMASKVEARLDVAPDLPPVDVDPNQMQQVFVNLINNATQAIAASGVGGAIAIRVVPWLDGVAVTVADDGPGVAPDIADKVFEPFFTTKPEGEGTGLGLSICQGIVREHGGQLTLSAGPGGGAVLRVELPAGEPPDTERRDTTREPGHLRVLVIDDEPHIQHYMRATLEAWGHTVETAGTGVAGLAAAARTTFDVIVSDLRMPELGGREMYEILRRDHPAVAERIVFCTGDTVRGDTLEFLESLERPYLRKPFALAELRAALAAAVHGF